MTTHDDLIKRFFRLVTYYRPQIWWITSRIFVLTVAITLLGLALNPKYVARTKVTFLPTRSEIGFASARPELLGLSPADLLGQTHAEALMSLTLAEDVARALQSGGDAATGGGGLFGVLRTSVFGPVVGGVRHIVKFLNTGRWETADPLTSFAQAIQSRTRVQSLPGSFVFQVGVTWNDPHVAARIANLLTERYVSMTLKTGQEEMQKTREYIEAQIKETQTDLAALEEKIRDYRVSEKLYASGTDLDLGLQELSQYQRDLSATRVNSEQLDARIAVLKPYQTPTAMASIQADRSGLEMRQDALEKVVTEQMTRLDKLPAKEAGLLDMYRQRTIKERTLSGLQDRLLDTRVAEAAQLSAMRVIDPAIPPLYPDRPHLLPNAVASILGGLLLSVGMVLLAEARRPMLRSRDDLGASRDAVIGIVPWFPANGFEDPDAERGGRMAEFFRGVAHGPYSTVAHRRMAKRHLEHLFVRLSENGNLQPCMLVSLNSGDGKTFVIEHLAKLAREAGRKVLLVDANLNHPALHRAFGKTPVAGLSDMLAGAATAREVVMAVDENLDFIDAGTTRLNGQSRWDLTACKEQLNELAAEYDLVLIDSAALSQDPAAIRLMALASRIVGIFDATSSGFEDLAGLRERLPVSARNVQFILNKVQFREDYLFRPGKEPDRSQEPKTAAPPAPSPAVEEHHQRAAAQDAESRRRFARRPARLPLQCEVNGRHGNGDLELRNIGYGGLCFVAAERYAPGTVLHMKFPFLDGDHVLQGEVVWSQEQTQPAGARKAHGVRFSEQIAHAVTGVVDRVVAFEEHGKRPPSKTSG